MRLGSADSSATCTRSQRHGLNQRGPVLSDKIQVIGAIARKGNVVCKMIEMPGSIRTRSLCAALCRTDVSLVATDEASHYRHLGEHLPARYRRPLERRVCARSRAHSVRLNRSGRCSSAESSATTTKCRQKYLPLYLNEFTFRFNNRKNPDIFDDIIARC